MLTPPWAARRRPRTITVVLISAVNVSADYVASLYSEK